MAGCQNHACCDRYYWRKKNSQHSCWYGSCAWLRTKELKWHKHLGLKVCVSSSKHSHLPLPHADEVAGICGWAPCGGNTIYLLFFRKGCLKDLKISLIFNNTKTYVFNDQNVTQELTSCLYRMLSEILNGTMSPSSFPMSCSWKLAFQALFLSFMPRSLLTWKFFFRSFSPKTSNA